MLRAWLAAFLLLCAAAGAQAAVPGDGVPVLRQHVTDLTGTLSAAQLAELEAPLAALEKAKGSQVAVLMIPTLGDRPIEDYALAVVEQNKLGRVKIDDGLLLLVAKDDRKARIEVGYGLEGVVTDAMASRVIREYLAPRFRENDYAGGIRDATGVLAGLVQGEPLPPPMAAEPGSGARQPPTLFFAVFLGLFIGLFASGTGLKPMTLRRLGAGGIAAGLAWLLFSAGLSAAIAAVVAFLVARGGGGAFSSGRGSTGIFPGAGVGWGGGRGGWGGGGGGGWSGGGGSFGGGGASGSW